MPVVYARGSAAGDGYSLSYTLSGPAVLSPDGAGATGILRAEKAAAAAAARTAKSGAIKAYSPKEIKKGWHSKTDVGAALRITISNDAPLTRWVEEPTKAHVITARVKKALFWPGAAHPVKGVQHPGTPGKHRLPALLAQLGQAFEREYTRRVEAVLTDQLVLFAVEFEALE